MGGHLKGGARSAEQDTRGVLYYEGIGNREIDLSLDELLAQYADQYGDDFGDAWYFEIHETTLHDPPSGQVFLARMEDVHGLDEFVAGPTEDSLKRTIAYHCWKNDHQNVCGMSMNPNPQETIDKFYNPYDARYLWEYGAVPLLP